MSRHRQRRGLLQPMGLARASTRTWIILLSLGLSLFLGFVLPADSRAQEDPHKLYLPLAAGKLAPAAGTPVPPTPLPGEQVYARGFSGAYDLGDYLLMGEVVNNRTGPIYDVDLDVTFYDAGGKVLVTSFRNSRGEVVSVVFDYPLIGALQPRVVMEYTVETFDDTLADTVATVQGEGSLGQ